MIACHQPSVRRRTAPPGRGAGSGFTLIEMLMTLVILSIVAAIASVFIVGPVTGYVASVQRAELTDTADLVLRRLAREVHLALPNSLRVANIVAGGVTTTYIEFIPTTGGGQYRDREDGGIESAGIPLNFSDSSACAGNLCRFDVVGSVAAGTVPTINVNDYIVVNNRGHEAFAAPGNAYATGAPCAACNRARVTGVAVAGNITTVTLEAGSGGGNVFAQTPPLPSPYNRFQVVPGSGTPNNNGVVTFACRNSNLAPGANMTRTTGYDFPGFVQAAPVGGTTAILAGRANCSVAYTDNATGRNGLLKVALTLYNDDGDESITLIRQIHVNNAP